MADDKELAAINREFAAYIKSIPLRDTTETEMDQIKRRLREILAEYQELVPPG